MIKLFASLLLIAFCSAILPAQLLNRQMKVESLEESAEIVNPEVSRSLIVVRSQVPDLVFDANRNIDVRPQSGGVWYVFFSPGTIRLKISAKGFEQLEIPPRNYPGNRAYVLRLVAAGLAAPERVDVTLIEISFQLNTDSVYSSYDDFAPMLSKSRTISYRLPQGEYTFRFEREGFLSDVRTVKVTEAAEIPVTLKAGFPAGKNLFSPPGIVVITSDPSGAEIVLDGQKLGNTPYQEELTAGNHKLELRKPMYYPNISTFVLQEGKTQSLALKLKPHFGYLTIMSTPPNSRVLLDGKQTGLTPLKKRVLESTRHAVRIDADLYHSYDEEFTIADEVEKTINVNLKPAFGLLELTTIPEDSADAFLDGQKVGVTPYASKLAPGKYILKVTKNFFSNVEEELRIDEGLTVKKTVTLPKNYGDLRINSPVSSIININGQIVGMGVFRGRFPPGRYQIQASRGNLYNPVQQEIFLSVGDEKEILLEPTPRLGSLSVLVEPMEASDAQIYLDNELKGKAPLVLPLLIGDYVITARKLHYLDRSRKITVKENARSKLTLTMVSDENAQNSHPSVISEGFVLILGGTFTMGSPTGVGNSDERPQHSVTLSDFYIDRYEVTYKIWKEVRDWAQNNGYTDLPPGRQGYTGTDDHPVTEVSWYDIAKWCNARSQKEGLTPVYYTSSSFSTVYETDIQNAWVNWNANGYRLPTEAEWEYAARGGNKSGGYTYSGSNDVNAVAWYYNNSNSNTHTVGTKQPNVLGIYDMSGNVWEWCWDWYGSYSSSAQTNPYGPTTGTYRMLRGGSFVYDDNGCRVAFRYYDLPYDRVNNIGFRGSRTK